ncbi:MAG: efflux RND transporter periplasmic adaptor subunit [Candidatus Aminicenantes bacterium]|nr:efflux RND transporter periplasmic adaptor subunit [Candidatus Aminicenantes bacterium]
MSLRTRSFLKSANIIGAVSVWAAAAMLAAGCARHTRPGEIRASGTIETREVRISAQTMGQVLELRVADGTRVKPGDVVAVLETETLSLQLRQAEAGTALAEAQLSLLRNGARVEDVRQTEELVRQAEAGLKVADEDARRMRELEAKGSVTAKQKDDAEARFVVAQAQAVSAREGLNKIKRLVRPEEIRSAEARLEQARAAADLLRISLADATLTSPAAGIVTRTPVEAGDLVMPGTTVAVVSKLDRVFVMIYLTEREMGLVKLGDRAEVRIDAFPDRPFPGTVTYISPEAEFTPKNVQTREDRVKLVFGVKVEIPNDDGLLKPGLPADALIHTTPPAK